MATPFSSMSLDPQTRPLAVLRYMLRLIAEQCPADYIAVFGYWQDADYTEVLTIYPEDKLDTVLHSQLQSQVMPLLQHITLMPCLLEGINGYASVLAVPLHAQDHMTGVLVLCSTQPSVYQPDDALRFSDALNVIRIVLENLYLYDVLAQNIIISQLLLLTAHTIVDNPSPQQIIDVLCERLFDAHISSCAILLYGPVNENHQSAAFDHLEVVATWSKRLGSGLSLGMRFPISPMGEVLTRLDNRDTVILEHNFDRFVHNLERPLQTLLRAERLRAMILLPLHAGRRKLGVLMVGTDQRHKFTTQELQNYKTISEFLGVSALSQILQQQRDVVQQGRAALLDAVTNGVVMVLPDTDGARVLTVNKVFTSIFGIDEVTARGLLLPDLLAQMKVAETVRRQLASVPVRDPSTQVGEFRMIHSDGYPLDIAWYSAPVYQKPHQIMGRIYTFHDVTAERAAVRMRSAFLSRVSHELRTPLTSIHGFAEFILEAVGHDLPPLAREYTEIILNSAKHLRAVFTDMIELTRADGGELKLTLRQAYLPDVIISVIAQLELQYKERQQTVVLEIDEAVPAQINIDVDRIMQVMNNLITNASKFSPETSTIQIRIYPVHDSAELSAYAPPELVTPGVVVCVSDEGVGFSQEDLHDIFTPFFRTEWARQNKVEGTGLGLAVARSMIELHRGVIWVEPTTAAAPGGHILFSIPAE